MDHRPYSRQVALGSKLHKEPVARKDRPKRCATILFITTPNGQNETDTMK